MPKLNRPLAASIVSDIRECVRVTREMSSRVGEIEHKSWKFPWRPARGINAMEIVEEHRGTAGEFYILLLELAYDRFQFFLRLVVEFMDQHPFVADFFAEVAQIGRPPQMSLASLLRLIWNRLKTLPDATSRLGRSLGEAEVCQGRISRGSQAHTEVGHCESCSMASDAIHRTISAIERTLEENEFVSATAAERKRSRDVIYSSTRWALMSRLTGAIGKDVGSVLAIAADRKREVERTREKFEGEIRDLRAEASGAGRRVERLEIKKAEVEEALENGPQSKKDSSRPRPNERRAKERLGAAVRGNLSLQQENKSLRGRIEDLRQQLTFLTDGNNVLQSQVGSLASRKFELAKEVAAARTASAETERDFRLLLTELKNENDSTKLEYEKRIAALQQEIVETKSAQADERKKRDENVREGDFNEESGEGKVLMPGDDPEMDMTRQLISNREKIDSLARQNERLSKTLSRLRNYRLTQQTASNDCEK